MTRGLPKTIAPVPRSVVPLLAALLAGLVGVEVCLAESPAVPAEEAPALCDTGEDPLARPTAVVLNYCRASFHRIQQTPSKRVLLEEQEKILNNLNLNPIADAEIIRLYTAVLSEIADVQIADHEREIIQKRHRRAVVHNLAIGAVALGTQVATQQYVSALRTGAKSWWDYRSQVFDRELDQWRVDKSRIVAFVDKSSLFLDTFWKLGRKRGIPDQWLIRGNDLDQLTAAINEPDPEVRLRVLRRMERFMNCYPPYWYYLARTQQALGQFPEALETYNRLLELGDQYFRQDEMLAAALANQALLEDYLGQPSAVETARRALELSTEVWEVNLTSGILLLKHGHVAEAEDAILRNLDVDLETRQSLVALLAVYHVSQDTRKLAERLSKPEIARGIPAPLLLECVGVLGTGRVPKATVSQVLHSFAAEIDRRFGPDDFRIESTPGWQLDRAEMQLQFEGKTVRDPLLAVESDKHAVRFSRIAEFGSPLQPSGAPASITLTLKYPETGEVRIHLQELSSRALNALADESPSLLRRALLGGSDYRVVAVDLRGKRTLLAGTPPHPLPTLPTPPIGKDQLQPVSHSGTPNVPAPAPLPPQDPALPLVPAF